MTTPRLPDWQARFGAFMESRRLAPFAWGSNDCCSFAGDCLLAITGVDPGVGHRDYDDAIGGARALESFGGVGGVGDALFGAPVPPLLARVGDIGMVTLDGRDSLAVCNGETWVGVGLEGLVPMPLEAASRAWRF